MWCDRNTGLPYSGTNMCTDDLAASWHAVDAALLAAAFTLRRRNRACLARMRERLWLLQRARWHRAGRHFWDAVRCVSTDTDCQQSAAVGSAGGAVQGLPPLPCPHVLGSNALHLWLRW